MGEHVRLVYASHFTIVLFYDCRTWDVNLLLQFFVPPFCIGEGKDPGIRGEDGYSFVVLPTHGKDSI